MENYDEPTCKNFNMVTTTNKRAVWWKTDTLHSSARLKSSVRDEIALYCEEDFCLAMVT